MKKILLLAVCAITIMSCGEQKQKPHIIKQMDWVLGDWEMQFPNSTFSEHWSVGSDSSYKGFAVLLDSMKDTSYYEELYITELNDTLWYQPTVSNQNDQREISFRMTFIAKDSVVFENPQHDFPQVITYVKTSDSSIHAFVSGYFRGEPRQDDFFFVKEK